LRSESTEREFVPCHTPTTTPSSSSRSPTPSLPKNDMSHEDEETSGYSPSVPAAGTYSVPQAVSHEQSVWENTTVTYPHDPTWGNVTHGPVSPMYNRSVRLHGMGNNPPSGPSPTPFNGPYPTNPTWGSGAPPAPTQEQLLRFWHLAQTMPLPQMGGGHNPPQYVQPLNFQGPASSGGVNSTVPPSFPPPPNQPLPGSQEPSTQKAETVTNSVGAQTSAQVSELTSTSAVVVNINSTASKTRKKKKKKRVEANKQNPPPKKRKKRAEDKPSFSKASKTQSESKQAQKRSRARPTSPTTSKRQTQTSRPPSSSSSYSKKKKKKDKKRKRVRNAPREPSSSPENDCGIPAELFPIQIQNPLGKPMGIPAEMPASYAKTREVKSPRQVAWDPYKIVWDEGLGYLADFDKDIGDVSPNWKYFRGSFPKKPHRKYTKAASHTKRQRVQAPKPPPEKPPSGKPPPKPKPTSPPKTTAPPATKPATTEIPRKRQNTAPGSDRRARVTGTLKRQEPVHLDPANPPRSEPDSKRPLNRHETALRKISRASYVHMNSDAVQTRQATFRRMRNQSPRHRHDQVPRVTRSRRKPEASYAASAGLPLAKQSRQMPEYGCNVYPDLSVSEAKLWKQNGRTVLPFGHQFTAPLLLDARRPWIGRMESEFIDGPWIRAGNRDSWQSPDVQLTIRMPLSGVTCEGKADAEITFMSFLSRQILRSVSAMLIKGGATIVACGQLHRVFNKQERASREKQFLQYARDRWLPAEAKTMDGLHYMTCAFTDMLYAPETLGDEPNFCITQNQVI